MKNVLGKKMVDLIEENKKDTIKGLFEGNYKDKSIIKKEKKSKNYDYID